MPKCGETVEGGGSDEFGEATHADVVGALVGGLLGLVVDLVEVGRGDAMCRTPGSAGGFLGLVAEFGDSGDALDDLLGIAEG